MDTKALEKFAQKARRQLHEQIAAKLERVLRTDSAEMRAKADAVAELNKQIAQSSRASVVERVAYTWFNRFCALRYMDANRYTRMGVVSPAPGFTQPEILQEAKQGHIDEELQVDRQRVFDLLGSRVPSTDPQQEAYRLLLVATCNHWHQAMPFMFQRIDDYTELLTPDDLLSVRSILQATLEALTEDACRDVELIGWLYQFYISEKKEEVDGKVKKGGKVEANELAAKTTLYTKDWVVRYLVENSLGRLWLLNRPRSQLKQHMGYYVQLEQPDTDFLHIRSPEELRICDPATGSGHILTYAFDLLCAIYEEEGYSAIDVPRLILKKNLYGIEIDERAGALAAFALMMKAREKDRGFFRRQVRPNICVLQPIVFEEGDLLEETWLKESGELPEALLHDLHLFTEANSFGSLLRTELPLAKIAEILARVRATTYSGQIDWLLQDRRRRLLRALAQAAYLAQTYHVVIANPPYLGGRYMNKKLKKFAKDKFPDSKSDLFAMFIERGLELVMPRGYNAMVTMESWMFLSSFEKMREKLLTTSTISGMVHMPYLGKGGTPMEINFGTSATIFKNQLQEHFRGHFSCVRYYETDEQDVPFEFPVSNERLASASAADFKKISGSTIAYWVSEQERVIFDECRSLGDVMDVKQGLATADNKRFLRLWWEVEQKNVFYHAASQENALSSGKKWFPYNKGGPFRRWYGNQDYLVNWENDGEDIKGFVDAHGKQRSVVRNPAYYFKPSVSWGLVTSGTNAFRTYPQGFVFDVAGMSAFPNDSYTLEQIVSFCNNKFASRIVKVLNPTLNFQVGNFKKLPAAMISHDRVIAQIARLIECTKLDWDSYEMSWNFAAHPLFNRAIRRNIIADIYLSLRSGWQEMTKELQQLEQENNRIFIEEFSLHEELTPDVPLTEITLTCNPHYRYGSNYREDELETRLLGDTMREFINYAVGCMFGRYSLDKPGLILANQGETQEDFLRQVPNPTFMPDKDNAIPMLDGDWFTDDITERFKKFLRITFGSEHYEENLAFIEQALGRDIRSYFLREFYDHHVKMYKKRPIYWLFSSSKGSFNCLIYMHSYRPDTVSVILNDYLREFRAKLTARKAHLQQVERSAATSQRDKTRALKGIDQIDKVLNELRDYEDEVLYPLATRQVQIDLDDGVLVNYNKFGEALKKVTGLTQK